MIWLQKWTFTKLPPCSALLVAGLVTNSTIANLSLQRKACCRNYDFDLVDEVFWFTNLWLRSSPFNRCLQIRLSSRGIALFFFPPKCRKFKGRLSGTPPNVSLPQWRKSFEIWLWEACDRECIFRPHTSFFPTRQNNKRMLRLEERAGSVAILALQSHTSTFIELPLPALSI